MLSVVRLLLPLPNAAIRPATLCLKGSSGFSNLCASQQTWLCNLARSFASSPVKVEDPVKQFEVLRPFGGGGPVVRTPVFAVIKVGGLQYKVSPGDLCYVERLKHLDVGAELKISSVQAAGTREQTFIGRPYVDGASVNAIIEVTLLFFSSSVPCFPSYIVLVIPNFICSQDYNTTYCIRHNCQMSILIYLAGLAATSL